MKSILKKTLLLTFASTIFVSCGGGGGSGVPGGDKNPNLTNKLQLGPKECNNMFEHNYAQNLVYKQIRHKDTTETLQENGEWKIDRVSYSEWITLDSTDDDNINLVKRELDEDGKVESETPYRRTRKASIDTCLNLPDMPQGDGEVKYTTKILQQNVAGVTEVPAGRFNTFTNEIVRTYSDHEEYTIEKATRDHDWVNGSDFKNNPFMIIYYRSENNKIEKFSTDKGRRWTSELVLVVKR